MEKIVYYTGSFCPVTLAHYECLKRAMEVVGASKGYFLPTADENIKKKMIKKMDRLSLKGDVRIKMLECFKEDNPNIYVSDYEIKIHDSDNTYKTFSHFKRENPNSELYYVMGADKLHEIPHWKNADRFLSEFKFVVFDRADMDSDKVINDRPLLREYRDNIIITPAIEGLSNVSSTKIREMFLNGNLEYRRYLHPGVSKILEEIDLNEYPEVDDYDFIDLKLHSGPHGITAAGKKVFLLNNELFNGIDKHELYDNIEFLDSNINFVNRNYKTEVILEDGEYYDLNKKYNNPLLISEASYFRTGGRYDQGGSDTLEEELCRISTLSVPLYTFGMPKLKWIKLSGYNECNKYPLANNVFIDGVRIIRYGSEKLYHEVDDRNSKLSVIMVPTLNLTKKDEVNDLSYTLDGRLNEEGIKIMEERLENALGYAQAKGFLDVMINVFGLGFHFDPSDSARILSDVFTKFNGCFKRVIIVGNKKSRNLKKYFYPNLKIGE